MAKNTAGGPGIPFKVLKEAEGQVVLLECIAGENYRGKLIEAEETMSCQLNEVEVTVCSGRKFRLESVYIRGHTIRFIVLPEILKKAAVLFQRTNANRGGGARGRRGRGRPGGNRGMSSGRGQAGGRGSNPVNIAASPTTSYAQYQTPYMVPTPATYSAGTSAANYYAVPGYPAGYNPASTTGNYLSTGGYPNTGTYGQYQQYPYF